MVPDKATLAALRQLSDALGSPASHDSAGRFAHRECPGRLGETALDTAISLARAGRASTGCGPAHRSDQPDRRGGRPALETQSRRAERIFLESSRARRNTERDVRIGVTRMRNAESVRLTGRLSAPLGSAQVNPVRGIHLTGPAQLRGLPRERRICPELGP